MIGPFTETLGQYLKRERESRSMSLEELSRATRIGLPFLEALERDDFGFLSQREFIPGFLKGYGRHLGLDAEEILRRYRIQSELASREESFQQIPLFPHTIGPGEESPKPQPHSGRIPKHQGRKRSSWKILLQVIIVSTALGFSWYIHQILQQSERAEKTTPGGTTSSPRGTKEGLSIKEESKSLEKAKVAEVQGKKGIVANRVKKTYYLPGMKQYKQIDPAHRVEFDSEEEAVKAGYRRAPQPEETNGPG